MDNYLNDLRTYFRNVQLNGTGADREVLGLLSEGKVTEAVSRMQNRDDEVDKAVAEYNTQTHRVQRRPNKRRLNDADYRVEKLPRNLQQYINEVELFFLLGQPVKWTKGEGADGGDDKAWELFSDFLKEQRFDSAMRQAKRLAGAETESAKLYRIYADGEEIKCQTVVLARSLGYRLRPLFDQYGNMLAFAAGYTLKVGGRAVPHWDFYFPDLQIRCRLSQTGWERELLPNPLGKIPVLYYQQPKAWDGAVARIDRLEMLNSKVADTNNYFADPIAKATADVIDSLSDPDKPGKMIQLLGPGAVFDYVNPPQSSATRAEELEDLRQSILFDTFTPDMSFDKLRGLGSVSGVAIRNAMALGYMKRDNRQEIYGKMLDREKNLAVEALCLMRPEMASKLRELKIEWEFSEPFAYDDQQRMASIGALYSQGVVSLTEAVHQLGLCDHPDREIERIREEQKERLEQQAALQQQAEPAAAEQAPPEK